jgi:leucyl-tRNA synthetase
MHLLYARFWTKVMADAGWISFREPFPVLRSQGVMHARDPETGQVRRMSKSAGNVVTPDGVAESHGADALRIYLLFVAPFENNTVWEEEGIVGARRFLERTWRLAHAVVGVVPSAGEEGDLERVIHRTIRRVTDDIEAFKFNTAVAALMETLSALRDHQRAHGATAELAAAVRTFILLLAPFAPHIAEELWERLGGGYSVHQQAWPAWDASLAAEEQVTLPVQVDGRVRDRLTVPVEAGEAEVRQRALASENVRRHLEDRRVARVIYVPGRLVNVVTTAGRKGGDA